MSQRERERERERERDTVILCSIFAEKKLLRHYYTKADYQYICNMHFQVGSDLFCINYLHVENKYHCYKMGEIRLVTLTDTWTERQFPALCNSFMFHKTYWYNIFCLKWFIWFINQKVKFFKFFLSGTNEKC